VFTYKIRGFLEGPGNIGGFGVYMGGEGYWQGDPCGKQVWFRREERGGGRGRDADDTSPNPQPDGT